MERTPSDLLADEHALGLIAWIVVGVVGLVAALGATAGILYATDFGVEATVTHKSCVTGPGGGGGGFFGLPAQAGNSITVKTKLFGIEHTLQDVPTEQCALVQENNFVRYNIRSERTSIWETEGGQCIYDTVHGPGGCDL